MLRSIWNNLKRWRKIHLGPVSVVFKLERSVDVTRNSGHRLKNASHRHQKWVEALPKLPTGDAPETAQRASGVHGLRGELALIVGVGPGFGYALARRLASEGMAVVVASRNGKRLDALTDEIEAQGGTAFAYGCDVTSEASVTELFALIRAQHGVPNLLVYSIQNFGPGETVDIELPAFEDGWRHNCLGPFLVAREAARAMLPLRRGTIILVGIDLIVAGARRTPESRGGKIRPARSLPSSRPGTLAPEGFMSRISSSTRTSTRVLKGLTEGLSRTQTTSPKSSFRCIGNKVLHGLAKWTCAHGMRGSGSIADHQCQRGHHCVTNSSWGRCRRPNSGMFRASNLLTIYLPVDARLLRPRLNVLRCFRLAVPICDEARSDPLCPFESLSIGDLLRATAWLSARRNQSEQPTRSQKWGIAHRWTLVDN